jgi:hypothetical protein
MTGAPADECVDLFKNRFKTPLDLQAWQRQSAEAMEDRKGGGRATQCSEDSSRHTFGRRRRSSGKMINTHHGLAAIVLAAASLAECR